MKKFRDYFDKKGIKFEHTHSTLKGDIFAGVTKDNINIQCTKYTRMDSFYKYEVMIVNADHKIILKSYTLQDLFELMDKLF